MNDITEKQAKARAAEAERRKQHDRLAQVAAAVLGTQDGQELLAHLQARFGLNERVFILGEKGEVNALRAAIRDGERAVVSYLMTLAKRGGADFSQQQTP